MNVADTLEVSGYEVSGGNANILLPQGWSLISYLKSVPMQADSALATIAGSLVMAKNCLGQIFWPAYGINTIGNMKPGNGYHIYVAMVATLSYPPDPVPYAASLLSKSTFVSNPVHKEREVWSPGAPTGSTMILLVKCRSLEEGTVISAFTRSGREVGRGQVENDQASITVWGIDGTSRNENRGASEGEQLIMKYRASVCTPSRSLSVLAVKDYLGGQSGSNELLYRADAVVVAEAAALGDLTPNKFSLSQNYPNPFNPSTTIRYDLPTSLKVSLNIYNTLGQLVATLVDEKMEPGSYTVQWNANVPSGVYFYRLQAGEYMEAKRMILLK
jgi:hypothetical protein